MSEPTIVFVFDLKHWYTSISPLSKIDLLDIVPHVSVQFGFDYQSQAYLMVITKAKWTEVSDEIKKKFMLISRRIKEEMDGPMRSVQRDAYENIDIFAAFEASKKQTETSQPETETQRESELKSIPEEESE